ncbi:MAG TPA: hypothetical protein VEY10_18150 [Flavisolibacter sp.]|jgi:hypothetical protein|nr:hypothetical protein [Flavisolibacter sp.]
MMPVDLSLLHAEDFRPYLNQTMYIHFEVSVKLPAVLVSVTGLENHNRAKRQPFSIVFKTVQKSSYYGQAIYIIEHPDKGSMEIFLVPLGPDGDGMKYEAVFS